MNGRWLSKVLFCAPLILAGVASGADGSFGVSQQSASWAIRSGDEAAVSGIHTGSFQRLKLMPGKGGGVRVELWVDRNLEGGRGNGRSGIATYDASVKTASGETVKIRVATRDGETATVVIGDAQYDLAKGSLFLVATSGDKPRIRQLKLKASTPKSLSGDTLKDFAESEPAIARFWRGDSDDE